MDLIKTKNYFQKACNLHGLKIYKTLISNCIKSLNISCMQLIINNCICHHMCVKSLAGPKNTTFNIVNFTADQFSTSPFDCPCP